MPRLMDREWASDPSRHRCKAWTLRVAPASRLALGPAKWCGCANGVGWCTWTVGSSWSTHERSRQNRRTTQTLQVGGFGWKQQSIWLEHGCEDQHDTVYIYYIFSLMVMWSFQTAKDTQRGPEHFQIKQRGNLRGCQTQMASPWRFQNLRDDTTKSRAMGLKQK